MQAIQKFFVFIGSTFIIASQTGAQNLQERKKYLEWTKVCDRFGYSWEPHTVETEDGWFLTVFRITAVKDQNLTNNDKPPILMQHGAGGSSFGWLKNNPLGPTLQGQLAERGYDVWVGNSRGTLYSNYNRKDEGDQWTLKDHWNFTWADMGAYDIPAVVERIREVTGKPKITLIGYSQGGAQIFYGLSKNQDWFAERVNRFVGLAACQYMSINSEYEEQIQRFKKFEQLGIYNYYGDDEASATRAVCDEVGPTDCSLATYGGHGESINSIMYFTQIAIEKRFQEPLSLVKWAAGERITPLVELSKIDRVPVSIVHGVSDALCDPIMIEWTYTQIQSEDKHIRFEHGGHTIFAYENGENFIDRMVETIETGKVTGSASIMNSTVIILVALLSLSNFAFF